MQTAVLAAQDKEEARRNALLRQFAILDTPREERFDRIVRLASRLTGAPIAMVTLTDVNRVWFKARTGLEADEVPRELAFCPHALLIAQTLVIEDAAADPRFAGNPFVIGAPFIRFYAGAQLRTTEGVALGTLCVLDHVPRQMSPEDVGALEDLARGVIAELELRRVTARLAAELDVQKNLAAELQEARARLEDFLAATSDTLWETDTELKLARGSSGGGADGVRIKDLLGVSLATLRESFPLAAPPKTFEDDLAARRPFRHVQFGRRDADGSEVWIEASGRPIFGDGGFRGYRGVSRDITGRKLAEARIRRMANEDPLTGLANRRLLQRRLIALFASGAAADASGLLLIDIDHFKKINDNHGHNTGDGLLRLVSERVSAAVRTQDLVARIGGDEFAVILRGADTGEMSTVANRILQDMKNPLIALGEVIPVSVSIGGVLLPGTASDPDAALKFADIALYRAKCAGRACYRFSAESRNASS